MVDPGANLGMRNIGKSSTKRKTALRRSKVEVMPDLYCRIGEPAEFMISTRFKTAEFMNLTVQNSTSAQQPTHQATIHGPSPFKQ